jgi:hypothetical protein
METAVRISEAEAALGKRTFSGVLIDQKFALRSILPAGELLVRDARQTWSGRYFGLRA